jgi:uncharacterized membrane protein YeaQ/YmgE (transglycosylase-associated protein family)
MTETAVTHLLLGLAGAILGWLIFTLGLGIGDDDVFDWGGILGSIIGVMILLPFVGWFMRRRQASTPAATPPPA